MNVQPIRLQGWRGPGCGDGCLPRSHDPESHERYGYERAMAEIRERIVRTGPLTVDLVTRQIRAGATPIYAPNREREVLVYLAERLGEFCSSDDLAVAIWGTDGIRSMARITARATVYRLKRRLGVYGRLITCERASLMGVYRLDAEPVS